MINIKKNKTELAVLVLLGIMALTCLLSLRVKSPTVDEFAHLPAGYYYWKTGDFSLYGKNPPLIKLLCALPLLAMNISMDPGLSYADAGDWRPWVFGTHFMRENAAAYDMIFFIGRLPVVLLSLLLGWYVFRWARELYGPKGGLLSLILYTFSPNILAHSRLVTTDVGCTCFMFMAVYYYWRSFQPQRHRAWIGAGICFGLALLSKFTALLLIPVFGLLLLFWAWRGKQGESAAAVPAFNHRLPVFIQRLWDGGVRLFWIMVVAIFITNLGYGFQGSFKTLRSIPHESRFYKRLAGSPLNSIPIPLPAAYLQGLDQQKLDAERGVFLNYLRGRLSNRGWWYYFFYAFFVKTPIPLHIGIMVSIGWAFRRRRVTEAEAFLILPVLVVLIVFSFFNQINVGLRYVLPIFPFLFVWLGQLTQLNFHKTVLRWSAGIILVGYVVSSVLIFPDYLAYFNALAGGPGKGYRHLLDSNLDWGQDLKRLKNYMDKAGIKELGLAYFGHVDPEIYGIHYHLIGEHPESGDIAVSANYLYGLPYVVTYGHRPVSIRPGTFNWLHAYQPRAHIGHTIFVYSMIPEQN
ncbi:MAG: hypothetical protein DRH17_07280 [Deltaproteobacteria bacterium]|nr:MAG: hypothetical protein DRH17_07280 [Deltaproteobacteria bacterium]